MQRVREWVESIGEDRIVNDAHRNRPLPCALCSPHHVRAHGPL